MKAEVIDGVSNLTGFVAVLVYDTKRVHFLSECCNAIKRVHKTGQVYDPNTQIVCDAYFLRFNVNYSYNYNMNSVELSDQLQNVY